MNKFNMSNFQQKFSKINSSPYSKIIQFTSNKIFDKTITLSKSITHPDHEDYSRKRKTTLLENKNYRKFIVAKKKTLFFARAEITQYF